MFEIPAQSPAASGSKPCVMVVDDDRLVLLTLAHALRQAGYDVIEADNGDDAILMARTRRPALALLDIRLQGLSGFDVAQHLKDYAGVPFIFISAYADEATRIQSRELGARGCLSKPVDLGELLGQVAQALYEGELGAWAPQDDQSPSMPPPVGADAGSEPRRTFIPGSDDTIVTLALGMLMQREGLDRWQAHEHLAQRALSQGEDLKGAAAALIAEHERGLRVG